MNIHNLVEHTDHNSCSSYIKYITFFWYNNLFPKMTQGDMFETLQE